MEVFALAWLRACVDLAFGGDHAVKLWRSPDHGILKKDIEYALIPELILLRVAFSHGEGFFRNLMSSPVGEVDLQDSGIEIGGEELGGGVRNPIAIVAENLYERIVDNCCGFSLEGYLPEPGKIRAVEDIRIAIEDFIKIGEEAGKKEARVGEGVSMHLSKTPET